MLNNEHRGETNKASNKKSNNLAGKGHTHSIANENDRTCTQRKLPTLSTNITTRQQGKVVSRPQRDAASGLRHGQSL